MTILSHDYDRSVKHPDWCDPLFCDTRLTFDPVHRATPDLWMPTDTDTEIAVATVREDEMSLSTEAVVDRRYLVALEIRDTGSLTQHGDPLHAFTSLLPADARRLAANLLAHADQVEALCAAETGQDAGTDGQVSS